MQRTLRRRFPAVFRRRLIVDRMGIEPISPILQGSVASFGTCQPVSLEVRPGIEPGLRPYHGRVLPEHLQTFLYACAATRMETATTALNCEKDATSTRKVIPAGIEPAISWVSSRRLRHWTTGSCQ